VLILYLRNNYVVAQCDVSLHSCHSEGGTVCKFKNIKILNCNANVFFNFQSLKTDLKAVMHPLYVSYQVVYPDDELLVVEICYIKRYILSRVDVIYIIN
jgi:hypothetical protein